MLIVAYEGEKNQIQNELEKEKGKTIELIKNMSKIENMMQDLGSPNRGFIFYQRKIKFTNVQFTNINKSLFLIIYSQ